MARTLRPPPISRLAWEALSGIELGRLLVRSPALLAAPRGDAPVAVLPGYGADDASTLPLRSFLRRLGHEVQGWSLGRNRGDVAAVLPRVAEGVRALAERRGRPVHLIGQSLGGVLARELARNQPDLIAQVITLGTPVAGGPSYTRLGFRYTPQQRAEIAAAIEERNRIPITVPVTAVFSRRDGIVAWEACIDKHNPQVDHIEVSSSHLGMGLDPAVWLVAARLLSRPPRAGGPPQPASQGERRAKARQSRAGR
jgi:triacylglycerol esterase/lipase EstA (alpha/beta hydrolase family)